MIKNDLLPPASEFREGNVFSRVCLFSEVGVYDPLRTCSNLFTWDPRGPT